jgi:hypothetical protein
MKLTLPYVHCSYRLCLALNSCFLLPLPLQRQPPAVRIHRIRHLTVIDQSDHPIQPALAQSSNPSQEFPISAQCQFSNLCAAQSPILTPMCRPYDRPSFCTYFPTITRSLALVISLPNLLSIASHSPCDNGSPMAKGNTSGRQTVTR